MSTTYLVDGFNVIHAVDRLREVLTERGPAAATRALVDLLARWLALQADAPTVELVFDGDRPAGAPLPPPESPRLRVRYVLNAADDDLMLLLERRGPRTLVSADGELVAHAARHGQGVVAPLAFVRDVLDDIGALIELRERERALSPGEVAFWIGAFSSGPSGQGDLRGEEAAAARAPAPASAPAPAPGPAPAPPPTTSATRKPPRSAPAPKGGSRAGGPRERPQGRGGLSGDEVAYWLEYFGEGSAGPESD